MSFREPHTQKTTTNKWTESGHVYWCEWTCEWYVNKKENRSIEESSTITQWLVNLKNFCFVKGQFLFVYSLLMLINKMSNSHIQIFWKLKSKTIFHIFQFYSWISWIHWKLVTLCIAKCIRCVAVDTFYAFTWICADFWIQICFNFNNNKYHPYIHMICYMRFKWTICKRNNQLDAYSLRPCRHVINKHGLESTELTQNLHSYTHTHTHTDCWI